MAPRLRRLDWVFEDTPVYFVTACTHTRRQSLANAEVHRVLLDFGNLGPPREAWLGAFVIMPDHVHLFVTLRNAQNGMPGVTLPTWMKSLKNALSKTLREQGVDAPQWQKGYFDHMLRSEESYAEKWEYVRDDPVRAGLVTRWKDWPYRGEPFPLEMRSNQL